MKKPLSKALKRFYGIGDFGFTLMSNVELYCFSYFLTNVTKFDMGITALILTMTSLVDVILSPFYGGIIDGIKPMKWGRYRSWLLLAPPIVTVFYLLQFSNIGTGMLPVVIICIGTILSHVIWNFSYVSNVALIPVISSTAEDRAQLSATRGAYNNAAKIVFSYVGLTFAIWMGTQLNNMVLGFTLLTLIMSLIYCVTYFAHFKMTDGYEETETVQTEKKEHKNRVSALEMLKALFQNPSLLVLLFVDLSRWIVNFVMAATGAYFFEYVMGDISKFSLYLLISNIMALLGSFLSKYVANKLSTRTASIIGFFALGGFILVSRLCLNSIWGILILLSCAQFFLGFLYALISALYSDTVVYSEWKTGSNASGWIMGLMNLPLKIGNLIKGAIIPMALAAASFSPDINPAAASPELKAAISNIFITFPGVTVLIGGLLLLVGYRLTREKVNQYQIEINERN